MFPSLPRLSKASRLPLSTKRGNKDFYKGTRQAYLPGGHRTGAPGKHVVRGKAKYRLLDERVRVFIGPGADILRSTDLKPYVDANLELPQDKLNWKFRTSKGLTPGLLLSVMRREARKGSEDLSVGVSEPISAPVDGPKAA